MGIISYAQNFEDVVLWRALSNVAMGSYIDIGAQHPVVDSVSKAFYEHGWRGINVEPTAEYAKLLREDRPDETVIQAIVSDRPGVTSFFEIPGGGLSTARRDIAEEHKQKLECVIVEALVTAVTLDHVLEHSRGNDIHWLKIDVEGFERQVLSGWQTSDRRPWIIVVEATHPNTTIDTYEEWEDLVLGKGYTLVYQDGLNRFYLHEQHRALYPHFRYPANVFDNFQLSGTATSMTRHLKAELEREAATALAVRAELEVRLATAESELRAVCGEAGQNRDAHVRALAELRAEAQAEQLHLKANAEAELKMALQDWNRSRAALEDALHESERRERTLRSLVEKRDIESQEKSEAHLKSLLEREHAHVEEIASLNRQTRAKEEQERRLAQQELEIVRHELASKHAALEQQRIDGELRQSELASRCERQINEAQARTEALQQKLLHNEQLHLELMLAHRQEAEARESQQRRENLTQLESLARALDEARAETEHVRKASKSNENELTRQLEREAADARRRATRHASELLERERLHLELLLSQQDAFAAKERQQERESTERLHAALRELDAAREDLKRFREESEARQRNLERQLECTTADARRNSAQRLTEHLEREARHSEQLVELRRQAEAREIRLVERHEKAVADIAAQLNEARSRIEGLLATLDRQERDFAAYQELARLDQLKSETDALAREQAHAAQLLALSETATAREVKHEEELAELTKDWQSRLAHLDLAHAEREAALSATCEQLGKELAGQRIMLRAFATDLDRIRQHWSWRMTRALRASDFDRTLNHILIDTNDQTLISDPPGSVRNFEPTQIASAGTTADEGMAGAKMMTLSELLALPRRAFIHAAYVRLLGRSPDATGLHFYITRLSEGYSKQSVLFDIAMSREGRTLTGDQDLMGLPDKEFVEAIYHRYLRRAADPGGKRYYLGRLEKGVARTQIIEDIASSTEARGHLTPEKKFKDDLEFTLKREKAERKPFAWRARYQSLASRVANLEAVLESTPPVFARPPVAADQKSPPQVEPEVIQKTDQPHPVHVAPVDTNVARPTTVLMNGQNSQQRTPLERHFTAYLSQE